MQRLILTLEQARDLQRHPDQHTFGDWAFALRAEREKPDTLCDPERMTIALDMIRRDCTDEQIADQLGWKPKCSALKQGRSINAHQKEN